MVWLMVDSMRVKTGGAVLGTDQDIVTILVPNTLVFRLVPIPGIGTEEFVGDTEIKQTLPTLIDLTHPMQTKDWMPDVGVSSTQATIMSIGGMVASTESNSL